MGTGVSVSTHTITGKFIHYAKRAVRVARKNPLMLPYHFLTTVGYRMLYKGLCLLPLQENKVFFASDRNAELVDNMSAVYDEMRARNLDYTYHFMLSNTLNKSPLQLVKLAYHLATSRFIFLDDYFGRVYGLRIRDGAELIQLWHAAGAFKRFGFGRLGLPGAASIHSNGHRNYTKVVVSSRYIAKIYADSFGISEDKVYATGVPRTDVLFDETYKQRVRKEILQMYPQLDGKKVITYAPTFRGGGKYNAEMDVSSFDFAKFCSELGDEYICLWRMHPFLKGRNDIPAEYAHRFIDVTGVRDMNDWLTVTDVLITDYSSACFEAALLDIPMVFFAYDLEDYQANRDFYYPYQDFVPGPIVQTTEQLVDIIRQNKYENSKRTAFVNYFFDHQDGRSAARVVDWIVLGKPELDFKEKPGIPRDFLNHPLETTV